MKYIYIILLAFTVISCETVIDIETTHSDPRLVIDASIDWGKDEEKGTDRKIQIIKLYFQDEFLILKNNLHSSL